MIRLNKGPEPQILVDNAADWTDVLLTKQASGDVATEAEKSRYRHPDIKTALVVETHNKCAYCESKLQHIHHGDIEHIMPKSLELNRIVQWDNLTLACEMCNQNKTNLDPDANQLIDPYSVNPRVHLHFEGAFIFAMGTVMGEATKAILDLNRPALIEQRADRLKYVMSIFSNVLRPDLPVAARRAILKDMVERETTEEKPFSAMAQDTIASMLPHIPAEVRHNIL